MPLQTIEGEDTGESSPKAAQKGISMVVASRIGMAAPGMIAIPLFMDRLEKKGILHKYPRISAPIQIGLLGLILTFATPLCCAIFSQKIFGSSGKNFSEKRRYPSSRTSENLAKLGSQ